MDKTSNKINVFVVCFWKGFFSANAHLEWVWIDCVTNSKTLTPEKKLVNYMRLCKGKFFQELKAGFSYSLKSL